MVIAAQYGEMLVQIQLTVLRQDSSVAELHLRPLPIQESFSVGPWQYGYRGRRFESGSWLMANGKMLACYYNGRKTPG